MNRGRGERFPKAERAERVREATRQYAGGATYTDIATQHGVTEGTARKWVIDGLTLNDEEQQKLARHARALLGQRYDILLATWFPRAKDGDREATEMTLKILDRIDRLTGASAPMRVESTTTVKLENRSDIDREIQRLYLQLEARPQTELPASADDT